MVLLIPQLVRGMLVGGRLRDVFYLRIQYSIVQLIQLSAPIGMVLYQLTIEYKIRGARGKTLRPETRPRGNSFEQVP
jgi:hypothetical protein